MTKLASARSMDPTGTLHCILHIRSTAHCVDNEHDFPLTRLRSKRYYNGLGYQEFHSQNALHQGTRLWSARGGICGRGVLLDWAAWAAEHNVQYHPVRQHKITVAQLEEVARWQKTRLDPGDILFLRTGFVSWCNTAMDDEHRRGILERAEYSGVEASIESCKW
jgi:hypothetical protein